MRTRRLGRSCVPVTTFGFGAAGIAGLYRAVDEPAAQATVAAAWDAGVRYFDTAPHYGVGLSERRLGAALRQHERGTYTVSTKVGRLLVPEPDGVRDTDAGFDAPASHRRVWDFSRDGVVRSLEDSLQRLGLARVDLVLIHDPDEHYRDALQEAYPALHELRSAGVVGAIGVGMNQWEMLAAFVRHTDVDVVMLAGRYTLLDQSGLPQLLPLCEQRGVSVLAAAVFNSGLLAQEHPGESARYDYGSPRPQLIERARRIAAVCAEHGATLPQAALQFPLGHPAVAGVVVGVRSPQEVRHDTEMFSRPVAAAVWAQLRAEGLLAPDVPVPGQPAP